MRHDNKGMSLIELILAMTMATVVMGAAMLFLRTALNTYTLADAHIDVQKEAQLNLEQIGTWIMEGNRVAAGSFSIVSGDTVVTTHSVSHNSVSESVLVVYDEPYSDKAGHYVAKLKEEKGVAAVGLQDGDSDTDVKVFWLGADGKLYMLHLYSVTTYVGTTPNIEVKGGIVSGNAGWFDPSNLPGGEDGLNAIRIPGNFTEDRLALYEDDEHMLAEYITDFSASLTNAIDSNNNVTGATVNLSMTYEEENVKYTIGNQYTIRNVLR